MKNKILKHEPSFKFTKYLTLLIGIYCFFFMLPTILLRKPVILPYFGVTPISILFTGTYFVLLDVITEVYGYYEGKKALYAGLVSYSLLIWILEGVVNLHQTLPANQTILILDDHAYNLIFDNIYVTWISVVFCTLIFDIFNIRLLSKWKFLLHSKYFILRSICSSSFAIILFSLVTNFFAFHKQIITGGIGFYWKVNLISICTKILSLIVFSGPASLLTYYLKSAEKIDITYNINIFKFNRNENE